MEDRSREMACTVGPSRTSRAQALSLESRATARQAGDSPSCPRSSEREERSLTRGERMRQGGSRAGREETAMTGRRLAVLAAAVSALTATTAPATAKHPDEQIVLPGATGAEGIAKGAGATFYAGDLFAGDIYRGNLQRGTAELFVDAPAGRMAVGMAVDLRHRLLFVAGGFDGTAHVYDTRTGATVATIQLTAQPALINDVAVTRQGAWFTDSAKAQL